MTINTASQSVKGLTYYSDSNGCIGTLNVETGERHFIGNPKIQFFDIAMNKAGELFGISATNQLYSINTSTGAAKLIGHAGWGINALTSGPDGQLYGVGNGQIYSISEKTGHATKIDCPDISSAGDVVYADGLLYITTTKDQLVTYNLETKETQVLVNNLPGVSTYGISLTADGLIVGVTTHNHVYQVNPLDGKVIFTGVKSDGPTVYGLASAQTELVNPVVPNRAPEAIDDVIQAKSGEKIEIAFSKLLGNDSDPDGDVLTIVSVQNAKNGTVTLEGDKVIFTPNTGYTGPAQFDYTISDRGAKAGGILTPQTQVTELNFENVTGATGKWNYVGLPKGWFTDNPSGKIEVGNQEEYGIKGNNGNKVVEIEAAHGDYNLYTIINSSAGEDVTISFDAAQRVGYWSKVAVLVDGVAVGVIQPTTQVLEAYTFRVAGTGEPMRVEFKSTDSNSFGVVMDNISIETKVNPASIHQNFENIIGATDKWNYVGLPTGWFTDNPSGKIEVGNQEEYGIKGNNGNKVVEIEAAHGDYNLYTFVKSTAGAEVTISFDAAQRVGYWSKVAVLVDGVEVGVIQPTTQQLTTYTFKVAGTGESMRVEFKSTDSNAFGVVMDNIKINSAVVSGLNDTATVNIDIAPPENRAPEAVDDVISNDKLGVVTISPSTLLSNDTDLDGDALKGVSVQDAQNGTVKFDGVNIIFTPTVGYVGPASFTYTISDGKGGTDTAKVDLNVNGTVAPATPTIAPDMTAATDTGISNTDNITKDNTPDFAIPNPGSNTPNLYVDGVKVPSIYNPNTGTLTPEEPLADGKHDLQYSLTNPQGQESGLSPSLPVVIDTIYAAGAPKTAPDMTAATDTGLSNTDNNTDDRTPDFAVTAPVGTTPSLYVDGIKVSSTYNQTAGTLTPNSPVPDGDHTISYSLTDAAGNESPLSPALPIVIGSQNQAPDAVDDIININYVGPVEIDILTLLSNDSDADGDKLQGVSVQDAQNGTVEVLGDKLIFTPDQGFEGVASFTYTVSDGNGGVDTATVNLNINISAPDAPQSAPDMTAATDTGISDSDDLTRLEMPDFAIPNPGDHIVTLYIDGTPYPAEYDAAKGVITPTVALDDGQYQISYTLKDPLTGKESAMSPSLLIEVDNDIYQPLTAVDMTDETDTGISNTDNITSDTTPDFAVKVPDGSTPTLIVDGVTVEAIYDADKGTLTPKAPLENGPHEVSYRLTDAAGNESQPSPALPIVIGEVDQNLIMNGSFEDVTGLTQTFYGFSGEGEVPYWTDSKGLTIDIHNDQRDGVKPTDGSNWADLGGKNSDNRIGQNVAGVVSGQVYKLEFDAGDIRTAEDGKAGDNLVTVYWGGEVVATINPTDGFMSHYEFNLIGGDGNGSNRLEFAGSGKLDNFGVSIDKISLVSQKGSQLSAVDMTAQTDSGMNDADNLTNIGVPGFVIDATDGRVPVLYVDGKEVESVFDATTNTVSPVYPLTEGQHLISYKLIDSEGNETPLSEPLGITIDTQAPQIGTAVDMLDASDNGESNQDDITTETKPSFAIEPAGENMPSLYIDGVKVPATYDAKNATLTPIEPLSEGIHEISYSLTDPAGNESAPSLPLPIEIKVSFDVPQENKAPDAKDDVIIGEQDHIITISPSELLGNDSDPDGDDLHGVSLQDPVNGTVYFDGQNVIFTPTTGYSGPASFTYTITDGKGGFDTATVNLVVEAIAGPFAPTSPLDMTPETDTGVSNTDNITSDSTPSFTIENAGFNTPNLYVDGAKVASTFAFGVLTPIDSISAGHHEVSYTLTNPAGKESAPSPVLSIKIETLAENSNPNAGDDYISAQSGLVVISPSELLANDTDPDGDTLQGVSLQDAVNGTVSFDGQNVIFTPAEGYTGPASFTYTITDGKGGFDTATVNLTIASPTKDGIIDFNDYKPSMNSAPPTGWFTDNPGGLIEVLPSDVYGIPGEVSNVLELERYKGDASNFYTFVESKAGETITLDFDYSARSSATWGQYTNSTIVSGPNSTSAVHIMVNGLIFKTIDTSVVGFTHFSLAIPGTGDIMRIEFQAADKNEVGGLIDNIDLSAVPIYLNGLPEGMEPIPVTPDVPVVDDQLSDQPSNGGVRITVEGSDGDTHLQGTAGNDVINGGGTKDIIQAGAGDDVIYGNAGDDVISGGAGNDKMDGGVGADTFTWTLADTNGAGVEVDTVYNIQQNDVIDLKDLLNGESHNAESLVNYLHFSVDGDKTTMYVSADGKFSEGNVDLANTTQQIEFVGVDLTAGGSMNDMQVIQNLLSNHQLITD
jgi:hypothetical protein